MKTIRLLQDVLDGSGEPLKEGSLHSLNDASANHWLKRGLAVEVSEELILDAPESIKADAPHSGVRHKRK